ncbi:DUF3025 domain-containing protein [uncultured Paraglaciecola sp.]|uniref:DUF3025 domain-containing protein n=1 Tax=uncultured Paraglaciecola sp. TaxID=1765024 RepID=UPI0030DB547A|tara:strand:+ start:9440 stop:10258 length:819 start_codon:yes stop_codon:yes gene_type:complete
MTVWHQDFIKQTTMLPMQQLDGIFSLSGLTDWPNAYGLNQLKSGFGNKPIPTFVCQNQLAETDDYYEQIIHKQNIIPTRPNSWHDLFNGLIWLQFPKTKGLLNQQHVEDIELKGLSPRTIRRNNLTHFDECGVIVTYQKDTMAAQLIKELAMHKWQSVFIENRSTWGKELNSFMFGHANLEMLLQPFIGLTGKWLAVEVDSHFSDLDYAEQLNQLDELLVKLIKKTNVFANKKPLYPLPLLGIPGLWDANKNPEFYDNSDYFRPLPRLKNNK